MKCKKCKIKKREPYSMFCSTCQPKSDYFDDEENPKELQYLKELLNECLSILDWIHGHKAKQKYSGIKLKDEKLR